MSDTGKRAPAKHEPWGDLPEVLVVEDEQVARTELKRVLKRNGFRVREASSCREAIHEVGSGEVGVVLMDLVLGNGPDGIDTAREIQQSHPDTSVIFISAYAQSAHYRRRAQEDVIHMAGWVEKPIQPAMDDLLSTISRELKKAALRKKLSEASEHGHSVEDLFQKLSGEVEDLIINELRTEFSEETDEN